MLGLTTAKDRLNNGHNFEGVLHDLLQENISAATTQKQIKEIALQACIDFDKSSFFGERATPFYTTKKILEENKVYAGDCRDILPLCAANKPKGIITDYPYGLDFQSNHKKEGRFNKILNDDKPFLDQWIRQSYKILPPIGFFLTFYRWDLQDELFDEIQSAGFKIKSQIVWIKGAHGMGDLEGSYGESHENAVFAVKGRYTFPKHTGRPTNILQSNGGSALSNSLVHPNEKPVWLIQRLVRDLSEKGDLIIEPFSGSGTTIEACIKEGRRCIAIEQDTRKVEKIGMNYIDYGNKRAGNAHIKQELW